MYKNAHHVGNVLCGVSFNRFRRYFDISESSNAEEEYLSLTELGRVLSFIAKRLPQGKISITSLYCTEFVLIYIDIFTAPLALINPETLI